MVMIDHWGGIEVDPDPAVVAVPAWCWCRSCRHDDTTRKPAVFPACRRALRRRARIAANALFHGGGGSGEPNLHCLYRCEEDRDGESGSVLVGFCSFRAPGSQHTAKGAIRMTERRAITTEAQHRKPAFEPVPAASLATDPEAEIGSLSRQLARGYADLVESHRRAWGITAAEAVEKARMPRDRALEMVRTEPVEQMTWWALATVMEHEPEATLAAWKRIGDAARQEWQSGHRTAQSLERRGTPWERARFLALREAFRDDWQPRGGIEAALVDLLAQSFASYLRWTERLEMYVETQAKSRGRQAEARRLLDAPAHGRGQVDGLVRGASRGGPPSVSDDAQEPAGSAAAARRQHRHRWQLNIASAANQRVRGRG